MPLYTPAFFAMAFANLCMLTSFGAFFLFPLFISEHGGNQADIGLIMGTFALASVLCRPWISEMIDRIGRKRSYTIGALSMSALPLVYLSFRGDLSSFYLPLVLTRTFHGIGFAICITAAFTFVADLVPRGRLNEGIGMFGVSGLVGSAIGPAFGELIIQRFGFPSLFVAASLIASLGMMAHLPVHDTRAASSRKDATEKVSFFSVLSKRRVMTVAVLAILFGFGLAASNNFVSPFASARNLTFISLYYIAYSSSAVLTRLCGARLADRFGEDRIIPYAMLLTGAGLVMLIFLGGNAVLIVSGFMTGCGHGFLYPCLSALAIRDEPFGIRGKITGAFTGSIDAGAFGGSIILGYIGEWASFEMLFLTAGMALLVGYGVFTFQGLVTRRM